VDPASEYRVRLIKRHETLARLQKADRLYSYARLLAFALGALMVWLAIRWVAMMDVWRAIVGGALWVIGPVLMFLLFVVRHDRVIRDRDATSRSIAFYERGLARIEDRWVGTGEPGDRFKDDEHLYSNDLDLFGRGSLFELLSIARTRAGEETLAAWLKAPAPPPEIVARQKAVDELTPRLDLREELALAGNDVRAGVDTDALVAWAASQQGLGQAWLRVVAALLSAAALSTAVWWAVAGQPAPFLSVVFLEVLFSVPMRGRIQHVLHAVGTPVRDLDILAHVLARLEREQFDASRLAMLRMSLDTKGLPASIAIGRLHRLSELHDWQHNQFFAPFAAALLWGTHLAYAIESWRREHGAKVATWLGAVGEFEAFGSLSTYRFEHPADPFAELVDGPASFDGADLGHPLLPDARMVRNDVRLSDATRLLVVSGSNMSGKSTLLRTVGINAVLALAGAPARATRLRLTPLSIGATLRIQDSLQEGRSRFYAEITRLRQLYDLAKGPVPLLFLLDELFHGTNSHDRLVGATGVLRSLLDRGAIGLITTHDLALTKVADDLAPRGINVHFEDRFEGGEIRFDYRMRPGPVTRSNALALMRAVGLDVSER
jgi:hypothetical protein